MELIGRLTANANIASTPTGSQLVRFRIACNHSYKIKEGEIRRLTTFFDCAYWRNIRVAAYMSKGTLAELSGRVDAQVHLDKERQPKARLNFYVNAITLHGRTQDNAKRENPIRRDAESDKVPF